MGMQNSDFLSNQVSREILKDGRHRGTVLIRSVPEIEEQRNQIINKQFTEMDQLSHSCELSMTL